jgi:formamidopyrimidine-DNA glycosylase
MTGKKIVDARQQGKYFWLVMDSPPHPLMHFGMAGWMKFSNDDTAFYRPTKPGEEPEWPPKFWKFVLQLKEDPKNEVAFVDPRRLARIRLVDAKAEDMRKTTPLKENGPDPVIDKDVLTVEWLSKKLRSKKVPVKALLLDQANISGIGNWVGDEVMYHARLHPEKYRNTFSDEKIKRLHDAIMYVCDTAIEANGDSDGFPKDWLMKHRWGKGKKVPQTLPNGEKITFLKVGGRTSAIVPSVQKKTAAVAGDVSEGAEDEDAEEDTKSKKGSKRKAKAVKEEDDEAEETAPVKPKRGRKNVKEEVKEESEEATENKLPTRPKRATKKVQEEVEDEEEESDAAEEPKLKKRKTAANGTAKQTKTRAKEEVKSEDTTGKRRSGRLSK